jgi:gliding motility associated protien GldN
MKTLSISFLILLVCFSTFGQSSTSEIRESDEMWKKRITRAIDLREKQNAPLFAANSQITRTIIEAVKAGELTAYSSDSLSGTITIEEFRNRISLAEEINWDDTLFMEPEEIEDLKLSSGDIMELFPQDLYQMEITEDLIFDKNRSQMKHDIKTLSIFFPADHPDNIKGIQLHVATFSYDELMNLWNSNPQAIWYNPANDSEHKSLTDAFELRLFSSYIIKVSNPNDEFIVDTYGGDPKTGIVASQWEAHKLMEFEHNLWEN